MLRPATPLSVIFLVAFVLLLISTISTPIIQSIPLGTYQGYNFGVFGYCKDGQCVGPKIGYDTTGLFSGNSNGDFDLDAPARHSLAAILIVHPIAAFLALVCFAFAVAAHFRGPSHSPRYLLGLLILTLPTLLVTLLAFLVDILLFVPHMQWGGWIVLAATVLIAASTVVTCAMRRTLVSRKARKKRIQENADMSGANYYDSLAERHAMMTVPAAVEQLPRADSPPPLNGSADKGGQHFATYEMTSQDARSENGRSINDRTPLDPNRAPSFRSASTGGGARVPYNDMNDAPPMPMNGRPSMDNGAMGRRPSRDQFGNPIDPNALPPPGLRPRGSQGSLGSNRSDGYGRGNRSYGPMPRGAPRGRYGPPPPRGGYGPRGGYRGGPPPPGWNGRGRGGPMMGRGGPPRSGPPGYSNDPYYNGPRNGPQGGDGYMNNTNMPIGTAMEMDARTGMTSPVHSSYPPHAGYSPEPPHAGYSPEPPHAGYSPEPPINDAHDQGGRENDAMLGATRHDSDENVPRSSVGYGRTDDAYVPPRAGWQQAQAQPPAQISRLQTDHSLPYSTVASSHALPTSPTSPHSPQRNRSAPSHHRGGSDNYYEDVAPQFAEPPATAYSGGDDISHVRNLPPSLTPGGSAGGYRTSPPLSTSDRLPTDLLTVAASQAAMHPAHHTDDTHSPPVLGHDPRSGNPIPDITLVTDHLLPGLEPIPDGARSPGEGSEASHFTSISERPVNPHWAPGGPGSRGGSAVSGRIRGPRKEDVILEANPDFSVPGLGGRGRGRGRTVPGGLTPGGRYPTDI